MNKRKLSIARKKINKIDQKILLLIKRRTKVIDHMLNLKKYKNQIVDHKRIDEILKSIKNKSIKYKIDPKITKRIWKEMIWSYVDYQRRKFGKK